MGILFWTKTARKASIKDCIFGRRAVDEVTAKDLQLIWFYNVSAIISDGYTCWSKKSNNLEKKLCSHSSFESNKNHKPPGLFWMQIVVRKTLKWKILHHDKRKRSRVSTKNSLMPKGRLFFTNYMKIQKLIVIVFIKHRYTHYPNLITWLYHSLILLSL